MNVTLIYAATLVLFGVFVGIYSLLFIHMPIPPAMAWGWFVGGWVKGLVAGAIVRVVIVDS